ncbi:hypothetical protein ASD54_04480 [Rhizobium sp. Root149]|uniref:Membrane-associated phospholipid phosphatase n=1 Tax=Rhizobium rhizoryzae TaxID=451876 RepID=A0A7W6LCI4_9HYPH|nr:MULTISPECIES: phosphatase PAP2 family protein [Rhizobium]KQZ54592.1 hypothetical protein ASD54_04480 [Rhizobium sp. Root149]MBB4141711.1 membrane-associated phospholipid phosphatase [Rhizobium rhizoryzae]
MNTLIFSSKEFGQGVLRSLADCLLRDAPLHAAILCYCLLALTGTVILEHGNILSLLQYLERAPQIFLLFMSSVLLATELIPVIMRAGRRRKLAYMRMLSHDRIARFLAGLILLISISIFLGAFTWFKTLLPALNGGFPHDPLLADLDRWLHGGTDPWRLLWSLPFASEALPVIGHGYSVLWYLLCFGGLFFVVTSPKADHLRGRYIASFLFCWIFLGNIVAGSLMSAGPAFYGAVTQDVERFRPLLLALSQDQSPFSASIFQSYLWFLHEKGLSGFGSGISAFPSIHVGLIVMNALFVWEHSRRWGAVAFAACLLTMASSVYLGWHYALDGYVAAGVMVLAHLMLKRMPRLQGQSMPAIRWPALIKS